METKTMTIKDILEDVLKNLNDMKVPMAELETIGVPVGRAIAGIKVCVEALQKAEEEAAERALAEVAAEDAAASSSVQSADSNSQTKPADFID